MRRSLALTAAALALVAACGSGTGPATLGPAPTADLGPRPTQELYPATFEPVTVPPPPSVDTVVLPTLPPTLPPVSCPGAEVAVEVAGRRVLVRSANVPARRPVVLVLHGHGGGPEEIELLSGATDLARRGEAVVAYPEGSRARPRGRTWATGAGARSAAEGDDVAFLAAVLDDMVANRCGDPERVLLLGHDAGAALAVRAACDPRLNGRVTAVTAVAAAAGFDTVGPCGADGLGPVPLLAVAGRADEVTPYDGEGPLLPQEAWFAAVAGPLNGCTADPPTRTDPSLQVAFLTAVGCQANTVLVTIGDGDHGWPGRPVTGQPARAGFLATDAAWALLSALTAA